MPSSQTDLAEQSELPDQWHTPQTGPDSATSDLLSLIPDPQLHALVNQALAANPVLQQTAIQLKEAQLLTIQSGADRYPQLSTGYTTSRNETPVDIRSNHSLDFNISWELDVWGKLADQQASALYNEQAAEANLEGARNSLAARVLQTALLVVKSEREVDIEARRVETFALNETIIKQRYRLGIGKLADWQAAGSSLASAEANLLSRQEDLARNQRVLSILLGDIELSEITLPNSLPAVSEPIPPLPAQVLAQRPDLKAALNRIQAADRDASVSFKRLLPSFSLFGDLSQSDASASDMLRADPLWSLLGNLSQPLFQGGRLKAQAESAQFAAERAYWSYQEALLNAVGEVENLVSQQRTIESQQRHRKDAAEFAQASLTEFEGRYRNGLANIIDLLIAQRSAFDAEVQLLQNQFDELNNRIDLALALGLPVQSP